MNERIESGTTTGDTEQVPTPSDSRHGRLRGWRDWWFCEQHGGIRDISRESVVAPSKNGTLVRAGECGRVPTSTWRSEATVFIKRSAATAIKPVGTDCYPPEVYNRISKILLWLALVLGLVMLACGCKSTTARYDAKTGDWKVTDRRFGINTDAEITASVTTNGTKTVTIKAHSNPSLEALKDGLATGLEIGKSLAK